MTGSCVGALGLRTRRAQRHTQVTGALVRVRPHVDQKVTVAVKNKMRERMPSNMESVAGQPIDHRRRRAILWIESENAIHFGDVDFPIGPKPNGVRQGQISERLLDMDRAGTVDFDQPDFASLIRPSTQIRQQPTPVIQLEATFSAS